MERDFKGIWIPKEIWLDNRLNVTEKALFAEINSLDTENHCTASNDYFSKFFDVSESTITRGIAHLKELGLIESEFDGRVRKLRVVKLTTLPHQIDEQINISSISTNISNTINTNISNNTNKNKEEVLIEDANYNIDKKKAEKIKWFVENYNNICKSLPKCTRLTDKRRKAILKIMNNFSEEEILQVFTNIEASDFCKGSNDRGWKANFDFILREDKFVSALEGRYNNKKRGCNVETISRGTHKGISKEEKEELRRLVESGELEEY